MRVLFLDDDPSIRSSLSRLFTLVGNDVVAVSGGDEALACITDTPDFDIVISDFDFGVVDPRSGVEICTLLRPLCTTSTRFILTSSLPREVPDWITFVPKSDIQQLLAVLNDC